MITPLDVNPYAPTPVHASSGLWISGGGADGQVGEIVAWLLRNANVRAVEAPLRAPVPARREFDFAETIAWAAATCGADLVLPDTTTQLRAACYRQRTTLPPLAARTVKGALLFGSDLVAVVIGIRDRVLTYSPSAGIVVVDAQRWTWTDAGLIPGVRGYLR